MDKVFILELSSEASGKLRDTQIGLPATGYEVADALEKLRVEDAASISIDPLQYRRFRSVSQFLQGEDSLAELNTLAMELSRLSMEQGTAFEGLLQMEIAKSKDGINLETLRALAMNAGADCCHVIPEVGTDAELGRFYAENGFIDAVKSVPDDVFELLDFESLGRKARVEEDGVFVEPGSSCSGGYVVQQTALKLNRTPVKLPQKPDYAILLELRRGNRTTTLPLPARDGAVDAALGRIGTREQRFMAVRCLDCCVPSLLDSFDSTDYIAYIDRFARLLDKMTPQELTKYKAVLDACREYDLTDAVQIAETLDSYSFTPQCASPEDTAMDFLRSGMGDEAAEKLRPFVNLERYGKALMEEQGHVLTGYGMVSRKDGQEPQMGGMGLV